MFLPRQFWLASFLIINEKLTVFRLSTNMSCSRKKKIFHDSTLCKIGDHWQTYPLSRDETYQMTSFGGEKYRWRWCVSEIRRFITWRSGPTLLYSTNLKMLWIGIYHVIITNRLRSCQWRSFDYHWHRGPKTVL